MSTLVITGNGFDIWHGLPTSYKHFHDKYSDALSQYTQYFDDFLDTDKAWTVFEESLGSFNEDEFLDKSAYMPDIEEMAENIGMLYGYEDSISFETKELIENITSLFNLWISSIKVDVAIRLTALPSNCKFINFNYTTTLQEVYGILDSNILHIHGKVWGKIVFGHGRPLHTQQFDGNTPWFDDVQKNARSVHGVFYKPVPSIIEQNKAQLKSYGDVKKIIVIGHSMNDIDKPYFEFILNEYPKVKWENYNVGDEIQNTHDRLIKIGVPKENLSSTSTSELENIPLNVQK